MNDQELKELSRDYEALLRIFQTALWQLGGSITVTRRSMVSVPTGIIQVTDSIDDSITYKFKAN